MCGRFTLTQDLGYLAERFDFPLPEADYRPAYNTAPTDRVLAVTHDGPRAGQMLRWGLVPSWAKDDKMPRNTFNARDDRLASSGMWRGPFKRSRGVVPATGFFEWKKADGTKQPVYITPKDDQGFTFAAVYDSWINEHGETVESCAIVTTGPNDFMASIHDRMPAILDEETVALWLDPSTTEADSLQHILVPSPGELMKAHPVSTRVNSYKNDDAELIKSVSAQDADTGPRQLVFSDSENSPQNTPDRPGK